MLQNDRSQDNLCRAQLQCKTTACIVVVLKKTFDFKFAQCPEFRNFKLFISLCIGC